MKTPFLAIPLLLAAVPAWADVVVSMFPAHQDIQLGDTVSEEIQISGLNPAKQALGAYDFNITYNPAIILVLPTPTYNSVQMGDPVTGDSFTFTTPGPGTIEFTQVSTLQPNDLQTRQNAVGGNFVLLTFDLTGVGLGTSTLHFAGTGVNGNLPPAALSDQLGFSINAGAIDGSITVLPTPEPAAWPWLALALAAIAAWRIRT